MTQILGIDASASSGDIKKRYMRLSLLIHPDKCKCVRACIFMNKRTNLAAVIGTGKAETGLDGSRGKG